MDRDDDLAAAEQRLIEEEMERKDEELRILSEMRQEAGFAPRQSLARTPPQGFSTPLRATTMEGLEQLTGGEKRCLTSPEEVQGEVVRRCLGKRTGRMEVPPIGGLLSRPVVAPPSPPPPATNIGPRPDADADLATAAVNVLAGLASASTQGIMDAVRAKTSKLNKDEIAAIGAHTVRLGAVIMQLSLRVAAAEQRAAIAEERNQAGGTHSDQLLAASTSVPPRSFANALKLGRGQEPVPIVRPPGPSVVIYPAEGQREALKTADDTRRVLLDAVRPGQLGLQIAGVRRVGNAGVVVQTTSAAAADTLRRAVPPTLRTVEPTERCPLIALTGIDKEATMEAVIRDLKEQNLNESDEWTMERLGRELRLVFRRGRHGNRSKWVCQASTDLRCTLITKGRIYLGWDVVEVTDHVSVTCCNKCLLYGHPEKYCRAKNVVCGNCGDEGHRSTVCQAVNTACAMCKKFGRKGAHGHRTAAKDCPARMHAEQQAVSQINYHG